MTPEGQIKKQICEWLSFQKCFFWMQPSGKVRGTYNKSRFMRNGVSDVLGVWNSRMLAIEVKAPGNTASEEQKEFINLVNAHGGIAFVAYSLDEVMARLNKEIKGK